MDRPERVAALCAHLREAFPDRGFLMHEGVSFCGDSDGELKARATVPIKEGDVLLVVPESHMLSLTNAARRSDALRDVLAQVPRRVGEMLDQGNSPFDLHEVMLAVAVMHALAQPERAAAGPAVVGTWPSLAQLRHLPLFWSDDELAQIRGTAASYVRRLSRSAAAL